MAAAAELRARLADGFRCAPLSSIMRTAVISVKMDSKLGEATELCSSRRIRHLPVVNDQGKLVGLVTDRNLRSYISPRVGTISENNADRETLDRRVHVIMIRNLVTGWSSMTLAQAAALMLDNRVGCLPVVDNERRLVGIVTTTDFLRVIAQP
jgi:acetoin utilization protein AcuB